MLKNVIQKIWNKWKIKLYDILFVSLESYTQQVENYSCPSLSSDETGNFHCKQVFAKLNFLICSVIYILHFSKCFEKFIICSVEISELGSKYSLNSSIVLNKFNAYSTSSLFLIKFKYLVRADCSVLFFTKIIWAQMNQLQIREEFFMNLANRNSIFARIQKIYERNFSFAFVWMFP